MIKGIFDLKSGSSLSHHTSKFGVFRPCGSKDITFSTCHMKSCDYMIKGTCELVSESPSMQVTIVPSFVFIAFEEVKI